MGDGVAEVRAFNRYWTVVIGLLDAGLLDTPYSLTEARVIFELAQRGPLDLVELRRELGLDAGYLTRILNRFKADGLVSVTTAATDGRRRVAELTGQGAAVFATLDARSSAQVAALLDPVPEPARRRLVTAMATIRDVLGPGSAAAPWRLRPLRAGDAGWVVQRNGAVYAEEFGWDVTYEALVARILADYLEGRDAVREDGWIAELDGEPVGSVFCVRRDDETAQLRLLLVEPRARGLGIGAGLVAECMRFARGAGYRRMVLWTNDVLVAARRIYEASGFELLDEAPHHSFGRDLVGQWWGRDLAEPAP